MISVKSVYWSCLRVSRSSAHSSYSLIGLIPFAFSFRLIFSSIFLAPSKPSTFAPCSLAFRSTAIQPISLWLIQCEVEYLTYLDRFQKFTSLVCGFSLEVAHKFQAQCKGLDWSAWGASSRLGLILSLWTADPSKCAFVTSWDFSRYSVALVSAFPLLSLYDDACWTSGCACRYALFLLSDCHCRTFCCSFHSCCFLAAPALVSLSSLCLSFHGLDSMPSPRSADLKIVWWLQLQAF